MSQPSPPPSPRDHVPPPVRPPDADVAIRVLSVEDHPFYAEGIVEYLHAHTTDIVVVHVAPTLAEARRAAADLVPDGRVNLALVDISLPDGSGLELAKDLDFQYPGFPVVMMSSKDPGRYGLLAEGHRARGYVHKSAPKTLAVDVIRDAFRGLSRFSGRPLDAPESDVRSKLTPRKLQVWRALGGGLSLDEICREYDMNRETLKSHRQEIRDLLGLETLEDVKNAAVRWMLDEDLHGDEGPRP